MLPEVRDEEAFPIRVGVALLGEVGLSIGAVAVITHGTTLATNAIIERKGAATALIATDGFRDTLAIADEGRYDQYDINIEKPTPLVPRAWRFTVPERMDVGGRVRRPLEEDAVTALVPRLEAAHVESVAIALMHSAGAHRLHDGVLRPDVRRRGADSEQRGVPGALTVSAPSPSILNAPYPLPVLSRHVIGQMLPDMVFGCLRQAIPERVPAEGTSCLWNIVFRGPRAKGKTTRYGFAMTMTSNGGTGARTMKDGLSATAFPSGVKGTPVEIAEATSPVLFWRKELRPDSGGAGRTRGGMGQMIEIESTRDLPFEIAAAFYRIQFPPRGRDGGRNGAGGYVGLGSGAALHGKGIQAVPAGTLRSVAVRVKAGPHLPSCQMDGCLKQRPHRLVPSAPRPRPADPGFGLDDLVALGEHICRHSERAVREEIARLPRGTWRYEMTLDGYDEPITLAAATTVSDTGIHVDYTGSSGVARRGINVPIA